MAERRVIDLAEREAWASEVSRPPAPTLDVTSSSSVHRRADDPRTFTTRTAAARPNAISGVSRPNSRTTSDRLSSSVLVLAPTCGPAARLVPIQLVAPVPPPKRCAWRAKRSPRSAECLDSSTDTRMSLRVTCSSSGKPSNRSCGSEVPRLSDRPASQSASYGWRAISRAVRHLPSRFV